MSGRLTQRGCEAGAQTPPLLRASSPLKPKINRGLTLRLVQRTGALQSDKFSRTSCKEALSLSFAVRIEFT
jgi:hypothetical protein